MSAVTASSALASIIQAMTPDEEARTAAAKHRESIEKWLTTDLGIVRMRETGSWHHGTAINRHSDVDYFVTMSGSKPASASTALGVLRESLSRGLTGCWVMIDRPAVRVTYYDAGPAVEITPAYFRETDDYDIPDPDSDGWIRSNPAVHLEYVDDVQKQTSGRAKGLIRLVKTWKAWNQVPLSSFYLEMRTAQYAAAHTPIIYDWDLRDFFKSLSDNGLREMNDPTSYGRRITAGTRSASGLIAAQIAVDEAARLASLARDATEQEDNATAVHYLLKLFDAEQ